MNALQHPLLRGARVPHGFGLRDTPPPPGLLRPVQVHGTRIAEARACEGEPPEADGVVSREPGAWVGVATADCVPVLLADAGGAVVAAVHAGWRGLAGGVLEAGVAALRERGGADPLAAIGPHIGPCCYEVDAPVLEPLSRHLGPALDAALRPSRADHARLDLGAAARIALEAAGVAPERIGALPDAWEACTRCDAARFHSYRRDGARAGRLLSWIAVPVQKP